MKDEAFYTALGYASWLNHSTRKVFYVDCRSETITMIQCQNYKVSHDILRPPVHHVYYIETSVHCKYDYLDSEWKRRCRHKYTRQTDRDVCQLTAD